MTARLHAVLVLPCRQGGLCWTLWLRAHRPTGGCPVGGGVCTIAPWHLFPQHSTHYNELVLLKLVLGRQCLHHGCIPQQSVATYGQRGMSRAVCACMKWTSAG